MQIPNTPTFAEISNSDERIRLQGPIIAANRHGNLEVYGTAFLIGEGWAMTAKHVVKSYLASVGGFDFSLRDGHKADFSFLIYMVVLARENRSTAFAVTQIYWNDRTDIALLRVKHAGGISWDSSVEYPVLQLQPPEIGESISVIGFPHSSLSQTENNVQNIHMFPRLSIGVVRDVHEMSRDSTNLKFPCFHTSAQILGHMSGSPVFNSKGYICGVACYSMEQFENEEPISYGATLWPSAAIKCDGEPPLPTGPATFFNVLLRGQIKAVDRDQFLVFIGDDGKNEVINIPIAVRGGWTPYVMTKPS